MPDKVPDADSQEALSERQDDTVHPATLGAQGPAEALAAFVVGAVVAGDGRASARGQHHRASVRGRRVHVSVRGQP